MQTCCVSSLLRRVNTAAGAINVKRKTDSDLSEGPAAQLSHTEETEERRQRDGDLNKKSEADVLSEGEGWG